MGDPRKKGMTFCEAKHEFAIRYYLWSSSEFEREIAEGFPGFRSFKTGTIWQDFQIFRKLSRHDQLSLAHGLLKRAHPEALAYLKENTSTEEDSLLRRRDNFFSAQEMYQNIKKLESDELRDEAQCLFEFFRPYFVAVVGDRSCDDESLRIQLDALYSEIPICLREEMQRGKSSGEKIKFVSKRRLLKTAAAAFMEHFGNGCVETRREVVVDPSVSFKMNCGDWDLHTHMWFGRSSSLLNYSHSIASKMAFVQQGAKGPYSAPFVIAPLISFSSWLGLTSQIQWECLMPDEVAPACDAMIKFCEHFFAVAPKLLKGLTPENFTTDDVYKSTRA